MSLMHSFDKEIVLIVQQLPYQDLLSNPDINQSFQNQLDDWTIKSKLQIQMQDPFVEWQEELAELNAQYQKGTKQLKEEQIERYAKFCRVVKRPCNIDYWKNLLKEKQTKKSKEIPLRLLFDTWQKELNQEQSSWQLEQIRILREEFLAKLQEWLELLKQLKQNLEDFGDDTGIWLDYSASSLTPQNIAQLKKWLEYFNKDQNVKKIAELLGRMSQISHSIEIEIVKQSQTIQSPTIDINSKEEIIGVKISKDLEHALPTELALMSDPVTAILFDLKYLEQKLMTFELQGLTYENQEIEVEVEQTVEKQDQKGPIILCVDTSGSMSGTPEHLAKAIAFFLGTQAKKEKRQCFIITFSTRIHTLELTGDMRIPQLIEFLNYSFHGGTDVAPALNYSLDLLEKEEYSKADVLIVSDFIMGGLPESLLGRIQAQREKETKFNSLVIGEYFNKNLGTHFDHEWVYNSRTQKVDELVSYLKERLKN